MWNVVRFVVTLVEAGDVILSVGADTSQMKLMLDVVAVFPSLSLIANEMVWSSFGATADNGVLGTAVKVTPPPLASAVEVTVNAADKLDPEYVVPSRVIATEVVFRPESPAPSVVASAIIALISMTWKLKVGVAVLNF